MSGDHALTVLARTFFIDATTKLTFLIGASAVSPEAAAALLDLHHDDIDVKDALAFPWLFGHAAMLIHHILPGIARV